MGRTNSHERVRRPSMLTSFTSSDVCARGRHSFTSNFFFTRNSHRCRRAKSNSVCICTPFGGNDVQAVMTTGIHLTLFSLVSQNNVLLFHARMHMVRFWSGSIGDHQLPHSVIQVALAQYDDTFGTFCFLGSWSTVIPHSALSLVPYDDACDTSFSRFSRLSSTTSWTKQRRGPPTAGRRPTR